jgi:GTPase involved in cell partitioning and DNA repair
MTDKVKIHLSRMTGSIDYREGYQKCEGDYKEYLEELEEYRELLTEVKEFIMGIKKDLTAEEDKEKFKEIIRKMRTL